MAIDLGKLAIAASIVYFGGIVCGMLYLSIMAMLSDEIRPTGAIGGRDEVYMHDLVE